MSLQRIKLQLLSWYYIQSNNPVGTRLFFPASFENFLRHIPVHARTHARKHL